MENRNLHIVNSLGVSNRKLLLEVFEHRTINDAVKYYTGVKKKKYTDEEKMNVFKIMQDEYNDVIQHLRVQEKENRKQIKNEFKALPESDNLPYPISRRGEYVDDNEYRKQNIKYEKDIRNIDDDLIFTNKKQKPTVDITNKFKKSSKDIVIKIPYVPHGTDDSFMLIEQSYAMEKCFESVKMINNAIPELRNALNEYKGIKIHAIFHLLLIHNSYQNFGVTEENKEEINEGNWLHSISTIPTAIEIKTITNIGEIHSTLQDILTEVRERIESGAHEKSGWIYVCTSKIVINISKYEPLRGGSYLQLPTELNNKKMLHQH